ncbi:hypothetical protein ACFT9I_01595 [Streptomyces sp. NPDC057137]|uniref:hypothetical protein n=1 Tax=Streptomyces sp. NPDC057137 TaxID=3346030 RepID=UPI00362F2E72
MIAADSRSVDVDDGSWGAGRLTCSGRGVWRWQPLPRFSLNQGRSAEIGTSGQTPALRLRAVVNLPWAGTDRPEVTKPRRTLLEQQLPHSAVAGAVTMLSLRRGAQLPAARWERGPFGNSTRSVGYTCTLAGSHCGSALKASVMLALPTTMESTVVACADVLIENPEAWAAAVGPSWDTRLGFDEVQAVLLSTWETAAELLPDVVGDPVGLSWAAPPTTELRMTCDRPPTTASCPPWARSSIWRRSAPTTAAPGRRWPSPSLRRRPWATQNARACCGRRWYTWRASTGTSKRTWTCCNPGGPATTVLSVGPGQEPTGVGGFSSEVGR